MATKDEIRSNLKALMEAKGVRNVDLARALNVSKAAVTNWLNGSNSIDIEKVPLICNFFGVDIDTFLGRSPSSSLDESEIRLVNAYRIIDKEGKRALLACVQGLLGEYRKKPTST